MGTTYHFMTFMGATFTIKCMGATFLIVALRRIEAVQPFRQCSNRERGTYPNSCISLHHLGQEGPENRRPFCRARRKGWPRLNM